MRSSVATSLRSSSWAAKPQAKSEVGELEQRRAPPQGERLLAARPGRTRSRRPADAPALVGQRLEPVGVERRGPTTSL